ncbi:EAL domain-containing protein [Acetobacterium paludosum]|nr:EAL domain-containing protein [Acetobacterium paludosum]
MALLEENRLKKNEIDVIKGKLEINAQLWKENQYFTQKLSKIGSWTYDLNQRIVYFSDEVYHILGVNPQDFDGSEENYYHIVHPDDLNAVRAAIQGAFDGKEYDLEYRILTGEGELRFVREKTKILYDENELPIKIIGTIQDITEIKLMEKEIIYMKKTLDSAQRLSNLGSWEINLAQNINFLSEEALRIFGITVIDYNGTLEKFLSFIHADDRKLLVKLINDPPKGKPFSLEYRIIKKDGSIRNLSQLGETKLDKNGNPTRIYGTIQDITEKKEMQEIIDNKQRELDSIEERYRVLVQESGDVYEIIEPDGTIKYISDTSTKVIKYRPEKLIGKKIYKFYEGTELKKLMRMVNNVLENPQIKDQQILIFKTKSGKNVFLEVVMQNLLNNLIIEGLVLNFRDVTKRVEFEKRMNYIATHDELSGLPNRICFKNELNELYQVAKEKGSFLAVMMLDFEEYKFINESLGFKSGDQIIIQMMIRLKSFFKEEYFISRYSEDKFGIIVKGLISSEAYEEMAQGIVGLFLRPFKVDLYEFDVAMNLGITIYAQEYQELEKIDAEEIERDLLIKQANIALLWAKKEGKNHFKFYAPDFSIENYKQFELRNDLRRAVEKKQFELFYQPIVKLKTSEILAAEALIRWNHPIWGLVKPDEFIRLAEETGVIIELGRWVLNEICSNYKEWLKNGLSEIKITFNVSSIQFYEKNFVENIKSILDEFELNPKFLIMEIAENILIEDREKAICDIKRLEVFGIKVSLDGVETGFSSLTHLNDFNIDAIKMDGVFIKNIMFDETTAIIAKTVINLTRELKIKLIAVGIENGEQLSFLLQNNCYAGQGYLYSKPLPMEKFEKILEKGKCKPILVNISPIMPQIERREYFRLKFYQLLKAELKIVKIKDKKMNVGNTKILIKNIGPGGLSFISNIKFPLERDFTLQFETTLLNNTVKTNGCPVWMEEINDDFYQYGVKFLIDEEEREELMKILYEIQINKKKNTYFEDEHFTNDSPTIYFNSLLSNYNVPLI